MWTKEQANAAINDMSDAEFQAELDRYIDNATDDQIDRLRDNIAEKHIHRRNYAAGMAGKPVRDAGLAGWLAEVAQHAHQAGAEARRNAPELTFADAERELSMG